MKANREHYEAAYKVLQAEGNTIQKAMDAVDAAFALVEPDKLLVRAVELQDAAIARAEAAAAEMLRIRRDCEVLLDKRAKERDAAVARAEKAESGLADAHDVLKTQKRECDEAQRLLAALRAGGAALARKLDNETPTSWSGDQLRALLANSPEASAVPVVGARFQVTAEEWEEWGADMDGDGFTWLQHINTILAKRPPAPAAITRDALANAMMYEREAWNPSKDDHRKLVEFMADAAARALGVTLADAAPGSEPQAEAPPLPAVERPEYWLGTEPPSDGTLDPLPTGWRYGSSTEAEKHSVAHVTLLQVADAAQAGYLRSMQGMSPCLPWQAAAAAVVKLLGIALLDAPATPAPAIGIAPDSARRPDLEERVPYDRATAVADGLKRILTRPYDFFADESSRSANEIACIAEAVYDAKRKAGL